MPSYQGFGLYEVDGNQVKWHYKAVDYPLEYQFQAYAPGSSKEFPINPVNKLEDITLQELAKVYSGEITNWKELGGDDKAIVVIGREDCSGTSCLLYTARGV